MSENKTQKHFFPALTGYRAIAAWMIFVFHFFPFAGKKYPLAANVVSQFHIGVDMFFVLSGFLITYRYFNDSPIHFRKYMVNRAARIYPMYFLITIMVFLVAFLRKGIWSGEQTVSALLSFTMLKALFSKYHFAGIAQGWTLTLEELFYFTAPLYFILIRKNIKWLWILPVVILAFGAALELIFKVPQNSWGFLQTDIHLYITEFFAGIALALFILKSHITKLRIKATYTGIAVIVAYLFFRHHLIELLGKNSDFARALEITLLSILGIAPLLWGLIFENTFIRRILSSRVMVLLGQSSYIFYLIHKGFIPVFINDHISDNKLVIFIILNLVSVLLFRFIEEPVNKWLRKKFAK